MAALALVASCMGRLPEQRSIAHLPLVQTLGVRKRKSRRTSRGLQEIESAVVVEEGVFVGLCLGGVVRHQFVVGGAQRAGSALHARMRFDAERIAETVTLRFPIREKLALIGES